MTNQPKEGRFSQIRHYKNEQAHKTAEEVALEEYIRAALDKEYLKELEEQSIAHEDEDNPLLSKSFRLKYTKKGQKKKEEFIVSLIEQILGNQKSIESFNKLMESEEKDIAKKILKDMLLKAQQQMAIVR